MKNIIYLFMFVGIIFSKDPIEYEYFLDKKDGIYIDSEDFPYSGPVFSLYYEGEKK